MFSYGVRVNLIRNPKSKTVAFASLLIDDLMEVNGFRVIDGAKGLFVSPPQHKGKDKEGNDTWYDDVRFIIDKEATDSPAAAAKEEIYTSIINAYNELGASTSRAASAQAHANVNSEDNAGGMQEAATRRPLW